MTRLQEIARSELFHVQTGVERQLTETGAILVTNYIYECFRYGYTGVLFSLQWTSTKDVDEIEFEDEILRGKLINRISTVLYKTHGVKFTDSQRQKLGNIIAENSYGGASEVFFDVVNYIRWRPGSFKENSTSCWWGSYKDGKRRFQNEMQAGEAAAIRLLRPATNAEMDNKNLRKWYKHYVGMGRCFAVVNNPVDVDIIFNGYGLELTQWKALLMEILGYKYSNAIQLYLGSGLYINGSQGIALFDDPNKWLQRYEDVGFGQYAVRNCSDCGIKFRSTNPKDLCSTCYSKKWVRLATGGPDVPIETAVQISCRIRYFNETRLYWASHEQIENGYYKLCTVCNNYYQPQLLSDKESTKCEYCYRRD